MSKRFSTSKILLPHLLTILLCAPALAATDLRVIDGDRIVLAGETIRILNIDTPEIRRSGCDAEQRLGQVAKRRVTELLTNSEITLARGDGNRMKDRHGRTLARVIVDGADIGDILIAEGLARKWDGRRRSWCEER